MHEIEYISPIEYTLPLGLNSRGRHSSAMGVEARHVRCMTAPTRTDCTLFRGGRYTRVPTSQADRNCLCLGRYTWVPKLEADRNSRFF